jgi:hypothetical protein
MQSEQRYFALPILIGALRLVAVAPILSAVLRIAIGGLAGVNGESDRCKSG